MGGVVASGGVKYPVPSKAVGIVVAVAEQGVGLDGWTGSALGVAVGLGAVFGLEDVDWGAVEGIGLAVGRIRAPLGQGLGLQAWVRVRVWVAKLTGMARGCLRGSGELPSDQCPLASFTARQSVCLGVGEGCTIRIAD